MHICVNKLTVIGSDNGLSPGWRQAIIWTNAGILLIGTLGTNFSEILIEIRPFLFKKMHLEMASGKWRPFCLGLNVLNHHWSGTHFNDVVSLRYFHFKSAFENVTCKMSCILFNPQYVNLSWNFSVLTPWSLRNGHWEIFNEILNK